MTETDPPKTLFKRLGLSGNALLAFAAAVILAGLNLTNLLYTLHPEWKPDPNTQSDATVKSTALDENVTQGQFYNRLGSTPGVCTKQQLQRRGTVAYIQVDAAGFKESSIGLRWFVYDAGNNVRQTNLESDTTETKVFKPRAPLDRQIAEVWVPSPLRATDGSYFVRFELYSNNVLLAFADTRKYSVPPIHRGVRVYRGPGCKPLVQAAPSTRARP